MDNFIIEKKKDVNSYNIWYLPKGEGGYLIFSATEQELKELGKAIKEAGF